MHAGMHAHRPCSGCVAGDLLMAAILDRTRNTASIGPMLRPVAITMLLALVGCASAPPAADSVHDDASQAQERRTRYDIVMSGDTPTVWIDGVQVAEEHLRRSPESIEVVSSSGSVLQTIPMPRRAEAPPVMLGARLEVPGAGIARHLSLDPSTCSIITSVMPEGPSAKAGLEAWDIVVAVDGAQPATPPAVRSLLRSKSPGDTVTLRVRRAQDTRDVQVTLTAWTQVPLPLEVQPLGASGPATAMPAAAAATPAAPAAPAGPPTDLSKGLPTAPRARDQAGRPMPVPQPAPTQP